MWIDPEGVIHTVALPHPADVLTPRALACLDRLRAAGGTGAAEAALVAEEDAFFDGVYGPDGDDEFVGHPPPLGVLDGEPETVAALVDTIRLVPVRWRLDVIEALLDLIDEG